MSNNEGMLIVGEGASDGVGKTTQMDLLKKHLIEDGYEVVSHHFPTYDSPQGALAKQYLAKKFGPTEELSPYFVHSLYAVDRAVTWRQLLQKEYEAGKIILLDRYTTSSLIYQSSVFDDIEERKKFIDFVCDYEYSKLGIQVPDQVIFLHAPFDLVTEIRSKRQSNDGVSNDIHESNLPFLKRVYDNSMLLADYLGWDGIDCTVGDRLDTIENIHQKVYRKVQEKLPRK